MATQLISTSGVTVAKTGTVAMGPLRTLSKTANPIATQGLAVGTTTRGISASGVAASQWGYTLGTNERSMSLPLGALSVGSIVSFLNLRLLSSPFTGYSPSHILRANPLRPFSAGYEVLVPKPVVVEQPEDVAPPIVNNFSPAAGTALSKASPISFDVTDDSGQFRRIIVVASFSATGVCEVIHDGDVFRGFYVSSSSRMRIERGFRYTVARNGGWVAAPTIQTFAMDASGNESN